MTRAQILVVARYLRRHPLAIATLTRAGWRLRRRAWWLHAPFLPVATKEYWAFRVSTASGDEHATMDADEMMRAATWAAKQKVGR